MNSDHVDLTSTDFVDISSKFTAGKRYRLQCTGGGIYRVTQLNAEKVACILFRAPTAQQTDDLKASVFLKPAGRPFEFAFTDSQQIHAAAPTGETAISITEL